MKNVLFKHSLLYFALFVLSAAGLRAQTLPQVPEQIQFANLTVRFDNGARALIQKDINALVQANRKYWDAKLERVTLYSPLIESILQQEGVPTDFKYLAVQESSLTPDAVSTSAAVGYWQFKRETAQMHGLRVDEEVDERKSIVASTQGAARYLKKSYGIYSNWVSALYSYYLGMGGISKLVPTEWANAGDVTLTNRTDRYILRFFAHKIALESALPGYRPTSTFALVHYPVSGRNIADVASELSLDEYEVRKYNRWVLGDQIPDDREYVLALPVANDRVADVKRKAPAPNTPEVVASARPGTSAPVRTLSETGFPVLRRINYAKSRPDVVLYEINGLPGIQAQRGDNAATLARKAKISLSSFLRYNDMDESAPVKEGEVYYLSKKMRKAETPYHTLQAGESMRTVSQMYGVRQKRLYKFNRMNRNDRLVVGRVLWLSERRPRNKPVEINRMPAPAPVSQPASPILAETPVRPNPTPERTASSNIPRNASERKLYTPKLVEPAPETSKPADRPAAPPMTKPSVTPAETTASQPSPTTGEQTMTSSANSRRVIIIRPEGQTASHQPVTEKPAPTKAAERQVNAGPRQPVLEEPAPIQTARASSTLETREEDDAPAPAPVTPRPSVAANKPMTPTVLPKSSVTPTETKPAPESRPATTGTNTRHVVESGQTYYSISRLYGVSINDLLAWNNVSLNDKLAVGQKLTIRNASTAPRSANEPMTVKPSRASVSTGQSADVSEEIIYHTVQKGETAFRISKQYGVSVDQLKGWNELADGGVKEGQRLKIIKVN